MEKMFGLMLPSGVNKLGLSRMNMAGMGTAMMKKIMKDKHVESLECLIKKALANDAHIMACSMSMYVMGIHKEELIKPVYNQFTENPRGKRYKNSHNNDYL